MAASAAAFSVTFLLPASSSTRSPCPTVCLPFLPSLLPLHNKLVHTVKRPTLCARSRHDLRGELKIQRRRFVTESLAAGLIVCSAAMAETAVEEPTNKGLEMLPFKKDGYSFWTWRSHKVHYIVQGQGPPMVLIHGFGASAFHWRFGKMMVQCVARLKGIRFYRSLLIVSVQGSVNKYNIPELAKTHTVYAMDLLGFGWSEKALMDYDAFVWRDQVADFVREVVGKPAVLAGNSVGGFTVLMTAAANPDLISGIALLNASGQFESQASPDQQQKLGEETTQKDFIEMEESILNRLILNPIKNTAKKYAILFAFWQAKQPARIKSVLQNVYKDQTNVDDYLVQSIVQPTQDPNAGEVYYRLMTQVLLKPSTLTVNKLLKQLSCPMLLLWGDLDPWMGPSKCDQIKRLYPQATVVRLQAGHCPHDEAPVQVNQALLNFANSINH